jgi:hypothetical protein
VGEPETASIPRTVRNAEGDRARPSLCEDRRDNAMGGPDEAARPSRAPRGLRAQRRQPEEGKHAEDPGHTGGEASDLREEESLEVDAEFRGSRRKSVSGDRANGKEAGGLRRAGTASRRDQTLGQDARADDRKVAATRAETPRQGMRPRENADASDDTMEL